MVAVVNFEPKRRGFCPRWWSGSAFLSCLAVLAPAFVVTVAEAQNLTSLRFRSSGGLMINGQEPVVFFERDAEQILTAQVFYEVDYGYGGGDVLFLRAEPFGASPAKLTPDSGSPSCSTATTPANVDLALQNPAWAPSGAATRHAAAPFLLDEDPDEVPPPQPRSFGFSFGTLCQDSAEEPTEQFRVTVWFQPAGAADPDPIKYPVLQYLVRIIDDDGEGGSEPFEIFPVAFTVRETDEDAPAALALTFGKDRNVDYCFPFELVYSRSTAGAADAWVGSRGTASGSFLLSAGSTQVVVDLLIAGDDEVEQTELLYVDVYSPKRASTCSGRGSVVTVLTVTIEDDDQDTSPPQPGPSPLQFTVRETDEDAPAALALTFDQAADSDYCFAFELAYGRSTAGRDDAWVGTGKASSGSFVLRAGFTEIVVRDVIVAGDDEVEASEMLFIDVYPGQRSSTCGRGGDVVLVLEVTIEDDDSDTSGISPTEFTVTETDADAPAALALTFAQAADADYCFAFELAYGRSTADRDDAWIGTERSSSGSFVLPAGLTEVVVRDLIIAGDDEIEETETLYIDVYERQRSSLCRPSGTVVAVLTVTIEDDDQGALIEFTLTPLVVQEPVRRRQAVVFDLQQSGGPEFSSFTVEWSTVLGTAQTGGSTPDYEPAAGRLTFDSGVTGRYISIVLLGDLVREPDETFIVSVRSVLSPDVSVVSEARFEVTITEADRECLSVPEEVQVPEGPSGTRAGVVVPVQVGCLVGERRTLVVSASETGGRRAARGSPPDQDFEPVNGLVHVVPAGVLEVDVPVTVVLGDNRPEPATETFSVSVALDSDSGSAGLRGITTVVILDDEVYFDEIVTLETPDSVPEGDPPFGADCGAHQYRPLPDACARGVPLLLTLNERFSHDLEFELYTLAETARADVDYQSIRGRRLVVREGHLVSFDVHEPLQLRVVPDLLPEAAGGVVAVPLWPVSRQPRAGVRAAHPDRHRGRRRSRRRHRRSLVRAGRGTLCPGLVRARGSGTRRNGRSDGAPSGSCPPRPAQERRGSADR